MQTHRKEKCLGKKRQCERKYNGKQKYLEQESKKKKCSLPESNQRSLDCEMLGTSQAPYHLAKRAN